MGLLKTSLTFIMVVVANMSLAAGETPVVNSDIHLIVVDKTALQAELWRLSDALATPEQKKVNEFKIAIGKQDGDKMVEGDNKTPEGIYFTKAVINKNQLPAKYGNKAIPIDFPNPIDRMQGKTGHGIWLHGAERDSRIEEEKVTEGCVAFYNSDIDQLSTVLTPYQSVVAIASKASDVNSPMDISAVASRAMAWSKDWSQRNINGYISFYSDDFTNQGKNKKQYKDYKEAVFGVYKVMNVELEKLRVITHPKYAVSIMNQDFQGDKHYRAVGKKILYWQKNAVDNQWYITREVFESSGKAPVQASVSN